MRAVFSQRLLAGLQAHNSEEKDRDERIDPDDSGPRLSVRVAEPNVEKIYPLPALPSPLPSEMPASWWEPLLFGKPGDAVNPQDAHLALALVETRISDGHHSGPSIKRDPGANVSVANELPPTIGALHELIYERYDSGGWFAFQQLYHEAAGLRPRPKPTGVTDPVVSNNDAAPLNCDAIEPGLAEAIMQAPLRVQHWMLAPAYEPPRWRTSLPPDGMDDGAWCG